MFSAIGRIIAALFGWFLRRGRANLAEVADSNARAQERLAEKEAENELLEKAARVRRDADARVLREYGEGSLDDNPSGYWRD